MKMLNSKVTRNVELENLKLSILSYIKKNKEAHISDLIENFEIDAALMIKIINELKDKKLIRIAD